MPKRPVWLRGVDLGDRLAALRDELGVPAAFPPAVLADADQAARAPALPAYDATDVPFVTIDPPGSMDLDQAMHLERRGRGYRVRYAIADVAAFVRPGSAVDAEAHARGETVYSPDLRTPLHPPALSESAASLLAGQERPAVLWQIDLDGSGEPTAVEVRRARVRSRARLDYAGVQASLDGGSADEVLLLLREVGRLREQREVARGGVSLNVPEQEVICGPDGRWALEYRGPLPVEGWNAQVSLLTGMAAARLMLDGHVGVLRTMPPPDAAVIERFRRSATALHVPWPDGASYADVIRSLDPTVPSHAALLRVATTVFRGAGYTVLDGHAPDLVTHSAVAAPYAHATAPLRRLVDRYVSECCLALCGGVDVLAWARDGLAALPEEMAAADRRAHELDRAVVDLVEAAVLQPCVGERFDGVIIEVREERGEVQLREPAVRGRCDGERLPLGEEVVVRLLSADLDHRQVDFALDAPPGQGVVSSARAAP